MAANDQISAVSASSLALKPSHERAAALSVFKTMGKVSAEDTGSKYVGLGAISVLWDNQKYKWFNIVSELQLMISDEVPLSLCCRAFLAFMTPKANLALRRFYAFLSHPIVVLQLILKISTTARFGVCQALWRYSIYA